MFYLKNISIFCKHITGNKVTSLNCNFSMLKRTGKIYKEEMSVKGSRCRLVTAVLPVV